MKAWSIKKLKQMWKIRYYRKLFTLGMTVLMYMLFGTAFYSIIEDWSFADAFYFTGMTVTTIGYGDLVPSSAFSKIFTIFYAFLGIGIVFYVVGIVGKRFVEQEEKRILNLVESQLGIERKPKKKK